MKRKFVDEETQKANKHIPKIRNSSVVRGIRVRTPVRYCFVSVTLASITNLTNTGCRRGCGLVEAFLHWAWGVGGEDRGSQPEEQLGTNDSDSVSAHLAQWQLSTSLRVPKKFLQQAKRGCQSGHSSQPCVVASQGQSRAPYQGTSLYFSVEAVDCLYTAT